MLYADHIILSDSSKKQEVKQYEEQISTRPLSTQIEDAVDFSMAKDQISYAKILILWISSSSEVRSGITRIFGHSNKVEKVEFLISQLSSFNNKLFVSAIELLGVLGEPRAVPALAEIFDLKRPDVARVIVNALGNIKSSAAVQIIKLGLESSNDELLLLCIKQLQEWVQHVSWKTFLKPLRHHESKIRAEAAFAIAVRRSPGSALDLLKAMRREKDRSTRLLMLRYSGMIPSHHLLLPLIVISLRDPDQTARLVASRSVDRLQALIDPRYIFLISKMSNLDIMAEGIFRLGKFGSENKKHKLYLRKTLKESKNVKIIRACILALGFISEHQDLEMILSYTNRDVFTSYVAAISLTRMWRLSDASGVIDILAKSASSIQRQIYLKFLIRRRGFNIDPKILLKTVEELLKKDFNLNMQYLSYHLLEFAPCSETIEFLLSSGESANDINVVEAIRHSLESMIRHHDESVLNLLKTCKGAFCCKMVEYLQDDLSPDFYEKFIETLFGRYAELTDVQGHSQCAVVISRLVGIPNVLRQISKFLPNSEIKKTFLEIISENPEKIDIKCIIDDLLEMIKDVDIELQSRVLRAISLVKDPAVVPQLVAFGSSDAGIKLLPQIQEITKGLMEGRLV